MEHDFCVETIVLISNGFHRRPTLELVNICEKFKDNAIFLESSNCEVDAKLPFQISMLCACFGSKLKICVDGPMSQMIGLKVKSTIDTSLFEGECKSRLHDYICWNGEKNPEILAKLISAGNIKKGQSNDLFYWLKRSPRKLSANQIAEELKKVIDNIHIVKKGSLEGLYSYYPTEKDIVELQSRSNNGILTVCLERGACQVLKFGETDIKIFYESVLDRLWSFDNEQSN